MILKTKYEFVSYAIPWINIKAVQSRACWTINQSFSLFHFQGHDIVPLMIGMLSGAAGTITGKFIGAKLGAGMAWIGNLIPQAITARYCPLNKTQANVQNTHINSNINEENLLHNEHSEDRSVVEEIPKTRYTLTRYAK